VLGLLVLGPVAALVGLGHFDGLSSQDSYAYFDYAVGPLRQAVLAGQLVPPPAFFWPPGYPMVVALGSLAIGPAAGQLTSLVMGALVPVLTSLLARELVPDEPVVALLAGVVAAVCGQLWQSSAVVMSDTTSLALATLGAYGVARYRRRDEAVWLALAGVALGFATITRWIYGLVAVVCSLYAMVWLGRPGRRGRFVAAAAGALLGGLLVAWVLAPAVAHGLDGAPFLGTLETYGGDTWSLANMARREFSTTGHGFVTYGLPNGVYYAAAVSHPFFLTPLLGGLALPGLVVLARRRDWSALGLLVGWLAAMYAFHAGTTWQNLRYVLAFLPSVSILAAIGAASLMNRRGAPGWVVRLWLAVGLVWAISGAIRLTQQMIDRKQADLATVRWVESQTPPDAQLLPFGPTLMLRHYGQRQTLELFELSTGDLPRVLAAGRPTLLLLDVANAEEQWLGRAPADDYAWLRDGPGLEALGTRDGLTLFRVRGT
jgi:4-amino-4-deoxy-L-arabinose transferase-like glycosyltransferase